MGVEDYGFRRDLVPLRRHLPQQCLKIGLPRHAACRRRDPDHAHDRGRPGGRSSSTSLDRRAAVPAIDLDEPFQLEDFHHYRLLEASTTSASPPRPAITVYELTRSPRLPQVPA